MTTDCVSSTQSLEQALAWVLRLGVLAASLLIVAGLLLAVATGHTGYDDGGSVSLRLLVGFRASGDAGFPVSLPDAVQGARELRPFGLIALGLLLLIATPITRVAVSVVAFALRRDLAYLGFTALVLAMLALGFLIGRAGE